MSYIFLNYLITYVSQNVLERTFLVFHVFCDITVERAISDDNQFSRTGENLDLSTFNYFLQQPSCITEKNLVLERTFFSDKAISGLWKA